ncbi:MAG: carboxypeptidase regulatory-like domain-containing protein [Armatimonadota bacterium]|nr:carboxypeptidase regulatory-like domain-containing protein [bacterium]
MTLGTTVTAPDCTNVGYLRFVNNYGGTSSTGKLEVITSGVDGNVAVKVSKTSASDQVQFDLDVQPTISWIPVQSGHTYRVTFWARTDDPGSALVLTETAFNDWTVISSQYPGWSLTSTWTMYTTEWVAPGNANLLDLSFILNTPGSFIIDNVSVEDESPATNLMPDPSFESLTSGTTITTPDCTNVGSYMRFVNNYGVGSSTGKLEVVSQAEDGSNAIKLSRTLTSESIWMDLGASAPSSWIPVQGMHTYRVTYWARTDNPGIAMSVTAGMFGSNQNLLSNGIISWVGLRSNWTMYTAQVVAPDAATHLNLEFWIAANTGGFVVDNVHVEDVVPATSSLTGTVNSMLTGAVIAGADVYMSLNGTTVSTTTAADGSYTFSSVPTGDYDMTVSANGYSTSSIEDVVVYGNRTKNVSLAPAWGVAWTVTDTFTRAENLDLGTTEDANAIPWVKTTANTNSSISDVETLYTYQGSADCGVYLGRNFTPADFQLSVNMTWIELSRSLWSGIAYRQNDAGTTTSGYFVNCPPDGSSIQLLYNGDVLATHVVSPVTDWQNVILGLSVIGSHHKVSLNGDTVIDVVDSNKLSGGYVGLYSDSDSVVEWDNLNVSFTYGTISGTVTSGGIGLADATVSVSDFPNCAATTASDGTYSILVPEGTYTVTASKSGYSPAAAHMGVVVTSDNTTDVDLDLHENGVYGVTVIHPAGAYSSAAYALSGTTPAGQVTETENATHYAAVWGSSELVSLQPAQGGNLIVDPSFESMVPGTIVSTVGETNVGDWRFLNDGGGTIEVVTPGEDGNSAVKLSRTSTNNVRMDRAMDYVYSEYPVKEGHTYKETFWLRTDDPGTKIAFEVAGCDENVENWLIDEWFDYYPTSTWTMYTITYTVPAGTAYVNNCVWMITTGSVVIDNMTMEDSVSDTTCVYGADASGKGGIWRVGSDHAALWTGSADSIVDMHPVGAASSAVNAVSNGWQAGIINVEADTDPVTYADHACIWNGTADSHVDLHVSTQTASAANGLYTSDGSNILVGGYVKGADTVVKACLWSYDAGAGTSTNTDLSSVSTEASEVTCVYGTNKAGYAQVSSVSHACLWTGTANTWSDLNPSAASASAIAYMCDGRQVGYATISGVDCAGLWKGTSGSFVNLSSYLSAGVYGNSYARSVYVSGDDTYVAGYAVNATTGRNEALLWVLHEDASVPATMSALKGMADGTSVIVTDTVVATAASTTFSDGSYYVETPNRATGIKATGVGGVSIGSCITNLAGTIGTDANGERYINVTSLSAGSVDALNPLGMTNKSVVDSSVAGLLVRTWGEVKSISTGDFMTIDDGSGVTFNVVLSGLTSSITKTIVVGDHVAVTGLAGFASYSGSAIPVVRPRGDSDIDLF